MGKRRERRRSYQFSHRLEDLLISEIDLWHKKHPHYTSAEKHPSTIEISEKSTAPCGDYELDRRLDEMIVAMQVEIPKIALPCGEKCDICDRSIKSWFSSKMKPSKYCDNVVRFNPILPSVPD